MFNSPILDVTIGLVFIFLLYSLLATSINEAISTGFAFRARMLKDSIIRGMLSNTPNYGRWRSLLRGLKVFVLIIFNNQYNKRPNEKNIGDQFYDHAIIKNFGSSRFFKDPAYLTDTNFSTILIDVLKEDFNNKLQEIALFKNLPGTSLDQAMEILSAGTDLEKIKNLIEYYSWYYAINTDRNTYAEFRNVPRGIDKDAHCILRIHLINSLYDLDKFRTKIEQWYNDLQDRVTGWYKRRTQFLLFCLGILIAISFNVDTIQIVNRLSTNKEAREQTVQLAIKAADTYKDDRRVSSAGDDGSTTVSAANISRERYDSAMAEARRLIDSDIKKSDEILALGWDDYGRNDAAFLKKLQRKTWVGLFYWVDSCDIMNAAILQQRKLFDSSIKSNADSLFAYRKLYIEDSAEAASKQKRGVKSKKNDTLLKRKIAEHSNSLNEILATNTNSIQPYKDTLTIIAGMIKNPGSLPIDSLQSALQRVDSIYTAKVNYVAALDKYIGFVAGDNDALLTEFYNYQYNEYPVHVKTAYILHAVLTQKMKWFGFLITAFAICLGAPFWFDLLNKLVRVRATGKKEDTDNNPSPASQPVAPVNVNVNTNTPKPVEEAAVG